MHDYKLAFDNEVEAKTKLSAIFGVNDDGELLTNGWGFTIDMIGHEPKPTGVIDEEGLPVMLPRNEYLVNVRTSDPVSELDKINRVVETPVREFQ